MGRIGAAKRGSGARHRLQAFLQAFPNLGCFSPSFSKESFGRFVGFQWVARLPNPKCPLPNILLSPWARRTRRTRPDQWGSLKAHRNTLAWMPFFRKKNRRFLFQRASAGRGVLRSGRLRRAPFARCTTSCATPAPAATVVRGRSPIAWLIARLSASPKRASARRMCRSAKSTVRFVYGDLRFHSQIANPLRIRDARNLAQHKGRYVTLRPWIRTLRPKRSRRLPPTASRSSIRLTPSAGRSSCRRCSPTSARHQSGARGARAEACRQARRRRKRASCSTATIHRPSSACAIAR